MSGFSDSGTSYIANLDRSKFGLTCLFYGLPFIVTIILSVLVLQRIRFNFWRVPYYLITKQRDIFHNILKIEVFLPWVLLGVFFVFFAPFLFLPVWGILTSITVNVHLGLTIFFIGGFFVFLLLGFFHWMYRNWKLDYFSGICFIICVCLVITWAIRTIFAVTPFSFIGVSFVFLGFNMIPIIQLGHYVTSGSIKGLRDFIGTDGNIFHPQWPIVEKEIPQVVIMHSEEKDEKVVDEKESKTEQTTNDLPTTPQPETNELPTTPQPEPALNTPFSQTPSKPPSKIRFFLYCGLLYFFSLAILLVYSITVYFLSTPRSGVGFISAAAVFTLDLTLIFCFLTGKLKKTNYLIYLSIFSRIALVIFGDRFWFVGHSILFLVLIIFFGIRFLNDIFSIQKTSPPLNIAELYQVSNEEVKKHRHSKSRILIVDNSSKSSLKSFNFFDLLILFFVLIVFIVDLIINAYVSDNPIQLQKTHPQYTVGLLSIFISFIVLATYGLYLVYRNNNFQINIKVLLFSSILYALIISGSWFLWAQTSSVLIITLCHFLPPIFLFWVWWFIEFSKNDFLFLHPPISRNPPLGGFWQCFWRGGLPLNDYLSFAVLSTSMILIVGMGWTLNSYNSPKYIGWTIMSCLLFLVLTFLPIIQWFYRFYINYFLLIINFLGYFLFFILMWQIQLEGSTSNYGALALLFVFFLYPTLVLFLFGIYKWRDDRWVLSKFCIISFSVCGILLLTFFILVSIFFEPWQAGVGCIFVFFLFLYAMLIFFVWKKNRYFLPKVWYYTFIFSVGLIIALAAAVGYQDGYGFIGTTIAWAIIFVGLLLFSFRKGREFADNPVPFLYSRFVFPVYKFVPGTGNPLKVDNSILITYSAVCVAFVWGVFATYFLQPAYVGVGVSCFCFVFSYYYTIDKSRLSLLQFTEAIEYLDEGSDLYFDILKNSKQIALNEQLLRTKSIVIGNSEVKHSQDYEPQNQSSNSDIVITIPSNDDIDDEQYYDGDYEEGDDMKDWHDVEKEMQALEKLIPPFNWTALFSSLSSTDIPSIEINQTQFTRRQTLLLLNKCDCRMFRLIESNNRFWAHFMLEVINSSHNVQHEYDNNILRMLHQSGFNHLSLQDINSLPTDCEDREILEWKLKEFLTKEKIRKQELAKKRKEEEEATIRREELLQLEKLKKEEEERKNQEIIKLKEKIEREQRKKEFEEKMRIEEEEEKKRKDIEEKNNILEESKRIELLRKEEQKKREEAEAEAKRLKEEHEKIIQLIEKNRIEEEKKRIIETENRKKEEERKMAEIEKLIEEEEKKRSEERIRYQKQILEAEKKRIEAEERIHNITEEEKKKAEEVAQILKKEHEKMLKIAEEKNQEAIKKEEDEKKRQKEIFEAEKKKKEAEEKAKYLEEQLKRENEKREKEKLKQIEKNKKEKEDKKKKEALQWKSIINKCIKDDVCTLKGTGNKYIYQRWYHCFDCHLTEGSGCCEVCRIVCHNGHNVKYAETSPFYCDCGDSKCRAFTLSKEKREAEEKIKLEKILHERKDDADLPEHKQLLEEIKQKYLQSNKSITFIDQTFPHDQSSLFFDEKKTRNVEWKNFEWLRPKGFGGIEPDDICQGALGDCWFLSALAVLTLNNKSLNECFVDTEYNEYGVYTIVFHKNGQKQRVVVDDFFPCYKFLSPTPAFAHSRNKNELWVMVAEKAYAKIHKNYEAIEGGFVNQALADMTGGIAMMINMTKPPIMQQIRNGTLWNTLLEYYSNGYMMGAGTPSGSDSEDNASSWGIVQGHAYSILKVLDVDGNHLILLRNPWGRKEWTGKWSDEWSGWTERLKKIVNYKKADDGSFFMSFEDFTVHFENIYICRFFREPWIQHDMIVGSWNGRSAGGCTNHDTVENNLQYYLSVTIPTNVVISLQQHDSRGTGNKNFAIGIEIYDNRGKKVTRRRTGRMLAGNPESYIFRREVVCEALIEPSSSGKPYTVLVSTFQPGEEKAYFIQVFSDKPCQFTAISD